MTSYNICGYYFHCILVLQDLSSIVLGLQADNGVWFQIKERRITCHTVSIGDWAGKLCGITSKHKQIF